MNYLIQKINEQAVKKNIPLSCVFELTQRCNLHCQHCYVTKKRRKELNFFEIKDILLQLKDEGVLFLLFTGGEVFLREDFLKIIKLAHELKFAFKFFTNGYLIRKTEAVRIAETPPLEIGISIYSDKSYIHDKITQKDGSFYRSCQAIKYLREKNLNVKIKCPLTRLNFKSIEGVKKIAEDLGCTYQFDVVLSPRDNGDKEPLRLRCAPQQLKKIIKQINPKIKNQSSFLCDMGKTTFAISPGGEVYPCLQHRISCGKLREERFSTIWHKSPYLHKMRNLSEEDLVECKNCADNSYCLRCFGMAHLEDKNFWGKVNFFCTLAQILKKIDYENKTPSHH